MPTTRYSNTTRCLGELSNDSLHTWDREGESAGSWKGEGRGEVGSG